jgi:hypothetical protein
MFGTSDHVGRKECHVGKHLSEGWKSKLSNLADFSLWLDKLALSQVNIADCDECADE